MKTITAALPFLALSLACSFHARGPEAYETDTRSVVETRNAQLRDCHQGVTTTDPSANGLVVVNFRVEKKTGKFQDISLDEDRTTAPPALAACVTDSLEGLALEPEDQRDGLATFAWRFAPAG